LIPPSLAISRQTSVVSRQGYGTTKDTKSAKDTKRASKATLSSPQFFFVCFVYFVSFVVTPPAGGRRSPRDNRGALPAGCGDGASGAASRGQGRGQPGSGSRPAAVRPDRRSAATDPVVAASAASVASAPASRERPAASAPSRPGPWPPIRGSGGWTSC